MRTYLAAFALAAFLCAVLVPLVRKFAFRVGAVSRPGGRNVNQQAIPRLGGITIAFAALTPLATLFVVDSGVARFVRQSPGLTWGLLIGGAALCVIGAWDDARGVRARYKLLVQILVAALAYQVGFRIDNISLPFLGTVSMGSFGFLVTIAWIVGITNAVNLIDGLDGLAAGIGFFAAFANFVVAFLTGDSAVSVFVATLMVSLMGSLAGFLFFNFNPARIYMGDSGSYFLGFVLSVSALMSPLQKASTAVSLLAPMVALGLPIFDTLLSLLRRYLEKRPLFSPDRGHIHHRLLDMGVTHRRAVVSLYGASVLLAGSAIAIALGRDWEVGFAILGASVVLIGLVRFTGYFTDAQRQARRDQRVYDQEVQLLRGVLPETMTDLVTARTEEALCESLREFGKRAKFSRLSLWRSHAGEEQRVLQWPSADAGPLPTGSVPKRRVQTRSDRTVVRYPVSTKGLRLEIEWSSDVILSARAEVLLQAVVDQLAYSLWKAGSSWVTEPSTLPPDPDALVPSFVEVERRADRDSSEHDAHKSDKRPSLEIG